MIRKLCREDISKVCELHLNGFENSFFCLLGMDFLRELYVGIYASEDALSYVFEDDDRVLGFVSGAVNPDRFFKKLVIRRFIQFSLIVVKKALLNPKIVVYSLQTLSYPGKVQVPADCEVLAIAVDEKNRGKGIGSRLLSQLLKDFKGKTVKVVVDEDNKAGNNLYVANGFEKKKTFGMYAKKINVYTTIL